jgi:hypothetical protein
MTDDLFPPSWSRVLARAHVTTVLAVHGEIADSEPTAQAEADGIRAELADSGAAEELEPWEEELLATPLVRWTAEQALDAIWRYEGAGVLAWWLGRLEMPAYDTPFAAGDVVRALTPWTEVLVPEVTAGPGRTVEELDALAEQLFTLEVELGTLTESVVRERRLAVAWLRGEDELWSEGSLDT